MSKKRDEKKKSFTRNVFLKYLLLYLLFFLLVAIIITSSIVIFGVSFNFSFNPDDAAEGALLTVFLIFVISMGILGVYIIIQHYAVNVPIKKIRDYLLLVSEGEFDNKLDKGIAIFGISQFNSMIDDINTTVSELKNIQTLRTDFVNNISHEVKTPLAVIQNYSKLLQSDELSDDLRIQYSKKINDSAEDLNSLVTTALNLNRIEHQNIFSNHEKFDLSEHIAVSILAYETKIEEKNITLDLNLEDNVIVETDKVMLQHVWNNLISNAIKFSNNNGVVSIIVKQIDDTAVVSIKDNGIGISEENKPHIFEKYFRGVDLSTFRGNGLGLSLVKNIIDALDMNITFESELGKGSTFVVIIDL